MKILMVGGLGYLGPVISQIVRSNLNLDCIDAVDTGWFLDAAVEPKQYQFDKIVTHCPHCFHTIGKEYAKFANYHLTSLAEVQCAQMPAFLGGNNYERMFIKKPWLQPGKFLISLCRTSRITKYTSTVVT